MCGRDFLPVRTTQKYCSAYCKNHNRQVDLEAKYGRRKCERTGCEKVFRAFPHNRLYCSAKCFTIVNRETSGTMAMYPGVAPATVGAIGELKVCVELLARGYEVFKAVSASCSCDLAILVSGHLAQVEVRTGRYNTRTGSVVASMPRQMNADIFAIVCKHKIVYRPMKEWIKCLTEFKDLW